jgi:dTDP-4-dehydrorhamnose reductase
MSRDLTLQLLNAMLSTQADSLFIHYSKRVFSGRRRSFMQEDFGVYAHHDGAVHECPP